MMTPDLDRWLICGTLTVVSSLQIRTGEVEECEDEDQSVLAIEMDFGNRPYIPASSLKGFIRSQLDTRLKGLDQGIVNSLFGAAPREIDDTATGRKIEVPLGGKAEFSDCHRPDGAPVIAYTVTTQTRVDRKTRTADDASLRTARVVPPGTEFIVEVMVDRASAEDIALLLAGLKMLNGTADGALGGGTGVGRGICEFGDPEIYMMGPADILAWMQDFNRPSWAEQIKRHKLGTDDLRTISERADALSADRNAPTEIVARLKIIFEEPFLIADRTELRGGTSREGKTVVLEPLRKAETDDAILTGPTLLGAISAQAERIFRTVFPGEPVTANSPKIETVFEEIFGKTGWERALKPGDFELIGNCAVEEQDFVAIDRFTGGASEGAKFAIAAAQAPTFKGEVRLRIDFPGRPFSAAALGLLCLLWRDGLECDLRLGYGTTKGFGSCRFELVAIDQVPLDRLKKLLGTTPPEGKDWSCANESFKVAVRAAVTAFRTTTANNPSPQVAS
jgi:CRISPR/Cas system CSM-associated protein Csm3 (group 7 of RAMP superfamily)